ncbi:hypothetical protein [Pseudogracilibacillus sp. SO10305]|uniref:hypothetical protein n=1 Tax=Pseudogracilibacillus sp. SO10305 TaxID=3098292 RepID=UPI00300E1F5C
MGWDIMSTDTYPCECGKGTYTEVREMDDWNRIRVHRTINCPICKLKAEEIENKLIEERKRLDTLAREIKSYFKENYIEQWFAYFSAAKSKKAVWEYSRDLRVNKGSLSTFYNRKYTSMEEYISELATFDNMKNIMEALDIHDNNLTRKVEEAMELYQKEHSRAIAEWHRKH